MIYLLRHGAAEDGAREGRRRARAHRQGTPAVRCRRTCPEESSRPEHRGLPVEPEGAGARHRSDRLRAPRPRASRRPPSCAAGRSTCWRWRPGAATFCSSAIEPDFSNAIAAVTGAQVKLRKGGLAAVEDLLTCSSAAALAAMRRRLWAALAALGRASRGRGSAGADPGAAARVGPDLRRDLVLLGLRGVLGRALAAVERPRSREGSGRRRRPRSRG